MPILRTLSGRAAHVAPALPVNRVLPAAVQRAVGPFVFLDHFGPASLSGDMSADVGPHPHIGLATVTYLLAGEMVHRDSIGTTQTIRPGDINLMSAGSGVVHSERVPEWLLRERGRVEGLQLWVALPPAQEDGAPSFQHVARSDIPQRVVGGAQVRVLIGAAFGATSPVAVASRTLFLDVTLPAGAAWELALEEQQLAVYSPGGCPFIDGQPVDARVMAVLEPDAPVRLSCESECRFIVIGGDALVKPVHMWWNFVSTDVGKIEHAAQRWQQQQFPTVRGETELVAMPSLPRLSPR